jgi:transcriptional regulator with XRE-family HTH domain
MSAGSAISAEDFRRIRSELGCTQTDIAEILGFTERQVARFESGAAISRPVAILMWLILLYRTDREDEAIGMIGDVFYGLY